MKIQRSETHEAVNAARGTPPRGVEALVRREPS